MTMKNTLSIYELPGQLFQRYWSDTDATVTHPSETVWTVTTRFESKKFTKVGNKWVMTTLSF